MEANKYYEEKNYGRVVHALEDYGHGYWKVWDMKRRKIKLASPTEYKEVNYTDSEQNIFELPEYQKEVRMYEFREELEKQYPTLGGDAWRSMRYKEFKHDAVKELRADYGAHIHGYMDFEEKWGTEYLLESIKKLDTEYKELVQIVERYFEDKDSSN